MGQIKETIETLKAEVHQLERLPGKPNIKPGSGGKGLGGGRRSPRAPLHRHLEDAACGALAYRVPVASEQDGDLGLCPTSVRPRASVGPPRPGRVSIGAPGASPTADGVASSRCFAMLRVAKTRCQGGSSCNLSRQAEGLHGGPPSRCLFNTNSVGDPHPSFKDRVSLLSERGQHRVSQGALHGRAAAPPSTVHFLRLLQRTRRNRVLAPHNLMAAGRCAARASVIFVLPPCSDLSNLQSDRLPGAG